MGFLILTCYHLQIVIVIIHIRFEGESMKVQEVQKKTQDEEKVRDEENIGCALSVVMLFLAIVAMASIVSGIVMLTEALWN